MAFDIHAAVRSIRGKGPMLILPHDNPDPDALAAALGMQRVAEAAGMEATIGLGGIIGRAENRAFVHELAVPLAPLAGLDVGRFGLVALVDTQPRTGNNSLPAGRAADIVIDHHPRREHTRGVPWCDIRDDLGASSAIVLEYLQSLGVALDERLATAFLYAIKSETRDLGREAGPVLRDAYLTLFPVADHDRLHRITHPKLGREHFAAVDRALRAAEVRGALVTANLGALEYPDLVAEVADLLLAWERARWVLCVGQHEGRVFLSIRTDVQRAHAGGVMRRLLDGQGAGGGHGQVAGGRLTEPVRSEADLQRVHRDLVARLAAELRESAPAEPLLLTR